MAYSIPEYIRQVKPYPPGKPIEEAQRELGLESVFKLASNENPQGPSPRALAAVQAALADTHRYPDATAFRLKGALVAHHTNVLQDPRTRDEFSVGCGSNEIIELMLRTFVRQGETMVVSQGAFLAYRVSATTHGIRTIETPLRDDYRFDLDAMARAICDDESVKMTFLPNPNNPTGTHNTRDEVEGFLSAIWKKRGEGVVVGLDDAYGEYITTSEIPNPFELQRRFKNVVVLKTFSKIYGLAGFRVGYGVADPEIISHLNKVKMPFNVASVGLVAAEAALSDVAYMKASQAVNNKGLAQLQSAFARLKLTTVPTQGNFVMVHAKASFGRSAQEVYDTCLRAGVIIRPLAGFGFPEHVRVSVGLEAENARLIAAFEKLKAGK